MKSFVVAALVVAIAGFFTWSTGRSMPPLVASHFDAVGIANGFMPRDRYTTWMTVVVTGLPLAILLAARFTTAAAAPRHARASAPFAAVLAIFLAFVHWLVVRANAENPPHLSSVGIYGALIVFTIFVVAWIIARRREPTPS